MATATTSGAPTRPPARGGGLGAYLARWADVLLPGAAILAFSWFGLAIVAARLTTQPGAHTVRMWALAALVVGSFVGFLFGIPRVLQDDGGAPAPDVAVRAGVAGAAGAAGAAGGATGAAPRVVVARVYRQRVNTNLEQISDWLTKILVGIGLVELGSVQARVRGAATALAGALAPAGTAAPPDAVALAAAVVVYFPVLGFMGGYLMTRLFLSGAFSRADQRAQATVEVGGQELGLDEAAEQQRRVLADLQLTVARLAGGAGGAPGVPSPPEARAQPAESAARRSPPSPDGPAGAAREPGPAPAPVSAAAAAPAAPPPDRRTHTRSLLWVDDNPRNNATLVDLLRRQGFRVTTALSTEEALGRLRQGEHYDAFVTDWARDEGGRLAVSAGFDLLRELQARGLGPAFVFAGRSLESPAVQQMAREAGARLATASSTELLAALGAALGAV